MAEGRIKAAITPSDDESTPFPMQIGLLLDNWLAGVEELAATEAEVDGKEAVLVLEEIVDVAEKMGIDVVRMDCEKDVKVVDCCVTVEMGKESVIVVALNELEPLSVVKPVVEAESIEDGADNWVEEEVVEDISSLEVIVEPPLVIVVSQSCCSGAVVCRRCRTARARNSWLVMSEYTRQPRQRSPRVHREHFVASKIPTVCYPQKEIQHESQYKLWRTPTVIFNAI